MARVGAAAGAVNRVGADATLSNRHRSLDELEPLQPPGERLDSYVVSEVQRLRTIPLKQLGLEDLRLLIGQGMELSFLVPMALDHLEKHPLAAGDFYRGDLLKSVLDVDEHFWTEHRELRRQLITAAERALLLGRRVQMGDGLEDELRAALNRHQTGSGDSVAKRKAAKKR